MKGTSEDLRNWQGLMLLVLGIHYDLMTGSIPILMNLVHMLK